MIQVQRTAKPSILVTQANEWLNEYLQAIEELNHNPRNKAAKINKAKAEKKYQHKDIKTALKHMFAGKCAYCESQVLHIDFGDIEHFRPKALFPNLCFEWNNLLLACGRCNSNENKGEQFPEPHEGGPLVNPVEEEPGDFFEFVFDLQTGTANVIPKVIRGVTTEKVLGLNRLDLVKHRSDKIRHIAFCALKARDGDLQARRILEQQCQKESDYAAFARAIADRVGVDY
jgi:uncharacterized protein (TIGR02646 family)